MLEQEKNYTSSSRVAFFFGLKCKEDPYHMTTDVKTKDTIPTTSCDMELDTKDARGLLRRLLSRKSRNKPTNTECPLSMDKPTHPVFKYVTQNGTVIAYSAHMLHNALLVSGDFRDPTTRNQLHEAELARLDRIVRSVPEGKHASSVLQSKRDTEHWKRMRIRREEFPFDLEELRNDIESVLILMLSIYIPDSAKEPLMRDHYLLHGQIQLRVHELSEINEIDVREALTDICKNLRESADGATDYWVAVALSYVEELIRNARPHSQSSSGAT